jgi:hypothetical protein
VVIDESELGGARFVVEFPAASGARVERDEFGADGTSPEAAGIASLVEVHEASATGRRRVPDLDP